MKDMQVQEKSKLDKNRSTNKQNQIKRSNTKLVLVQAKLQYLSSIGTDLSLKESLISG